LRGSRAGQRQLHGIPISTGRKRQGQFPALRPARGKAGSCGAVWGTRQNIFRRCRRSRANQQAIHQYHQAPSGRCSLDGFLAEYRAGRTLRLRALMQTLLTWSQDLGSSPNCCPAIYSTSRAAAVPIKSGRSAMVVTPALRGLFGLDWDAVHRTLRLAPSLPAGWDHAKLHNVPLGNSRLEIEFTRSEGSPAGSREIVCSVGNVCLVPQTAPHDQPCRAPAAAQELALPLPAVEIGIPVQLPLPGGANRAIEVVASVVLYRRPAIDSKWILEAPGGADTISRCESNQPNIQSKGAELAGSKVRLRFPAGPGYQRVSVIFSW